MVAAFLYLSSRMSIIEQLKQLEVLNLFDNKITFIPDSIGQLNNINYLQLGRNEIIRLPESIGSMHTVTTLAIFSNKLTVLPPQLSQLKNLEELNIGDNNISRIGNISITVQRLSIYANPVDYIDPIIPDRFKDSSGEYQTDYLFIDSVQASVLKLEKDKLGKQLKIKDLAARKIHWTDYKHMPQELIKKWELQRSIEPIEGFS